MYFYAWIPTAVLVLVLFLSRKWILAHIERSVQNKFDSKLEMLKVELRKSEETFKSELRLKESEISALRDGVLSGRSNRQALFDKRRLEAVEKVWKAVVDLAPYKNISAQMSILKFDAAAREASKNPEFRKFLGIIKKSAPGDKFPGNTAELERPFIPAGSWAIFSAYQSAIGFAYAQVLLLESGIENAAELLTTENVQNLLKAVLPHQATLIDTHGSAAFHHLLDELEQKLLGELRKILQGKDADEDNIAQTAKIMELVQKVRIDGEKSYSKADSAKSAP
jgi:hypothetical protein